MDLTQENPISNQDNSFNCAVCNHQAIVSAQRVVCFICKLKFHFECIKDKMSVNEFDNMRTNKCLIYLCNNCAEVNSEGQDNDEGDEDDKILREINLKFVAASLEKAKLTEELVRLNDKFKDVKFQLDSKVRLQQVTEEMFPEDQQSIITHVLQDSLHQISQKIIASLQATMENAFINNEKRIDDMLTMMNQTHYKSNASTSKKVPSWVYFSQ